MHERINRPRLRVILCLSSLLLFSYFPFLKNIYAKNDNAIHLTSRPTQNPGLQQKFQKDGKSEDKTRGFTLGVNVDLVMMYTSVFNDEGHFIRGLKKEDFNVYEDGVQQEISFFSQEDVPLSLGIVIDTSNSMDDKIEQLNRAAYAFIKAGNPQDEFFLVGFNDEVELLQPFTSDMDEITDALENAVITGGTALYDAIFLGVEEAERGEKSKKAIVVITDGIDKDSVYTPNELVASIQEAEVQIFTVGFLDKPDERSLFKKVFSKSEEQKAQDALVRISEETGGKAFFPKDISEIHDIVSEIAMELRNQYSIGYISNNTDRDGSWRRVVVRLNRDIDSEPHLRYRRGYYAPKGQSAVGGR